MGQDVIERVTTRQARTVHFLPGRLILEARRRPVEWRNRWYMVVD